jgi:trehalose-6-phosphatase
MEVIHGKNELYVVPKQLTRRKVLKKAIKLAGNREPVDFILYIADDQYNEKVFSYLNTLQ